MSSVEAVLLADPGRAKVLLSELLDKEVPPIQRSILEAKIASAFKRLHGHEIKLIRADVDEAHSFLSKYALETGAEPANVDLSKLKGDLKFDQYKEREDTTMSGGLTLTYPFWPLAVFKENLRNLALRTQPKRVLALRIKQNFFLSQLDFLSELKILIDA